MRWVISQSLAILAARPHAGGTGAKSICTVTTATTATTKTTATSAAATLGVVSSFRRPSLFRTGDRLGW